jgi:hypothetical protein
MFIFCKVKWGSCERPLPLHCVSKNWLQYLAVSCHTLLDLIHDTNDEGGNWCFLTSYLCETTFHHPDL